MAGISETGRLSITTAMLTAMFLLAASTWLAGTNLVQVKQIDSLGEQVSSTRVNSRTLLSRLTDAETGQRGYLLTGNLTYLEPYIAARNYLSADFTRLRAQPHLGVEQGRRLDMIHTLAMTKMAELARTISLAETGQRQAALDRVRTNEDQHIMDAIRVQLEGLAPSGQAELRESRSNAKSPWPRVGMVGFGILSSLLWAAVALKQCHARRAVTASLVALEQFTAAFDLSHGMLRDANGNITFWAKGMEYLYGYSSQEAVGQASHALLRTKLPIPLDQILNILACEGHWEGELEHRHKNGSIIEVASHWARHPGGLNGASDVIIEVNNDISEARRSQRASDRSSALLRAIIEAAPVMIYAKELDGRMLLANSGTLELIGKSWTEVEGRTDLEYLVNSDQARILMANDRRIMKDGQGDTLEEFINDPTDTALQWLSIKTPLRDGLGQVIGLVGVFVDITDRRRHATALENLNNELQGALTDLAQSNREFRAGFEFAAVGKLQADPQGQILRVNDAFANMLGYEPHDLVGRNVWDLTLIDDLQGSQDAFAPVFEGLESHYVREKRYIRSDGSAVWARASATVARSPSGAPYMLMVVVENIDERHKAQLALVAAKTELERTVVDRTSVLDQRDLLLREVYHRVKNNLQIIDSMLLMQSRQLADPQSQAAISSLRSRVFALGLVHHQLMGSADLKTFDVAPFLEQLVANLAAASGGNGIKLTIKTTPMNVGLDFAIPLGLVMRELVANSLKHAFPDGMGTVDISFGRRDDGTIDLVVSDNGRGYEWPAPARRRGLGTNIIAGLVAQLQGKLTFDGHTGVRTAIHFARPGTT